MADSWCNLSHNLGLAGGEGRTSMKFFYESGLEIIKEHADKYNDGRTRVLLFFLGSSFDEPFLRDVLDLAEDIDWLTGPHCLAVAFTPAPSVKNIDDYSECTRSHVRLVSSRAKEHWESFSSEMTKNTYAMANYLGVDAADLPCLAFVNPKKSNRAAIMRMPDGRLRAAYPAIRKLFLDWYGDYRGTLDRWDYLTSFSSAGCHNASFRPATKAIIHENLVKFVVPKIAELLRSLVSASDPELSTFERLIGRLRRQPWNTEAIDSFLRARNITIPGSKPVRSSWSLGHYLAEAYERDVQSRDSARAELALLRAQLPEFPLERVTSVLHDAKLATVPGRSELNGDIASVLERLLNVTATAKPVESHHYHAKEITIMRDQYNVGQGMAVGPNAHVHDATANQVCDQAAKGLDLQALASELAQFRAALSQTAQTANHYTALAEVAAAESAAKKGDGPKALQHLKDAGLWIWDVANKVGVGLAIAGAKTALGI
jgi:hypothetical protein